MRTRNWLRHGVASLLYAVVNCQKRAPNGKVLRSFEKKFPSAKYSTWQHLEGPIWEAAFLWEEKEHKALFEENGTWLETRTYMPLANVPKAVREVYRSAKTSDALVKVFRLETRKEILYEFQLNEGQHAYRMRYDTQGKIV